MDLERVGEGYEPRTHCQLQQQGWKLLESLSETIKIGWSEADGHEEYKKLVALLDIKKSWHPPKIRFGKNTTKPFRAISDPEVRLQENDIFFLDLGPVLSDYEVDVGRTFTLGHNLQHQKIKSDSEILFFDVKNKWRKEKISGAQLYSYAEIQAEKMGWKLQIEGAKGHRISDFPHAIYHKGSLHEFNHPPQPSRWILEIQLIDPNLQFGAFYEDMLIEDAI